MMRPRHPAIGFGLLDNFLKMYRKSSSRFLKGYVQKGGFKDGLLGFTISWAGALYQFMSYVKYKEMLDNEPKKESCCCCHGKD